jgi:hypothetical protein
VIRTFCGLLIHVTDHASLVVIESLINFSPGLARETVYRHSLAQ